MLPWDQSKKAADFDIDHKKEAQLGGGDESANLMLLRSALNRSAGPAINAGIEADIRDFLEAGRAELKRVPSVAEVKGWAVKDKAVKFGRAEALTTATSKAKALLRCPSLPPRTCGPSGL